MKAKVTFSKIRGKQDDQKLHSVAEFCRIVANECSRDIYGYFSSFYSAFIADTMLVKRNENENTKSYHQRVLAAAEKHTKSTSTKDLQNSDLYQIFSSKNQLFKLCRTILPAFYTEEMQHRFAKVAKVAFFADNYTKEEQKDLFADFYLITLQIDGKEKDYYTKKVLYTDTKVDQKKTAARFAELLQAERKQRKANFAEMKESSIYFVDTKTQNICTLVDHDKLNFQTLYSLVSEYAQRKNFDKVASQQEREKNKKAQKEIIAANQRNFDRVAGAFSDLLKYKNDQINKYKGAYIADDAARLKVEAGFIEREKKYINLCCKSFESFNAKENPFLADIAAAIKVLCKDKPAASKKASSKPAASKSKPAQSK